MKKAKAILSGLIVKPVEFYTLLLSVFLFLFAVNSCRSDEKDSQNIPQDLIGLWQPYRTTSVGQLSTGPYREITELNVCEQKSRFIFSPENKAHVMVYEGTGDDCKLQSERDFTYTYNGSTKIISAKYKDGAVEDLVIKELSPTQLVFDVVTTETVHGESQIMVTKTYYNSRTKD